MDGARSTPPRDTRPFLRKLWDIVDGNNGVFYWEPDGRSFRLNPISNKWDIEELLLKYFKSGRFDSFSRQLSYWHFCKRHGDCCWHNDLFRRDAPENIHLIKRKTNTGNLYKKQRRMRNTPPPKNPSAPKKSRKTPPPKNPSAPKKSRKTPPPKNPSAPTLQSTDNVSNLDWLNLVDVCKDFDQTILGNELLGNVDCVDL